MKNIHIENTYKIWNPSKMRILIIKNSYLTHKDVYADRLLNRSYSSMYIEWLLHNIGYYITLPLLRFDIEWIRDVNLRCKDVDLDGR